MEGLAADAKALIESLSLSPHPEGGWYRETWRSPVRIAREALPLGYDGDRSALTSILFLLPSGARSRWHRVRSEELWLHQRGDDLLLRIDGADRPEVSPAREVRLGQGGSAELQAVVPPGHWQEAVACDGPAGYALVGCVVAPGFEFSDFEMASR